MLLRLRGSAEAAGCSSPQSPRRDGLEALDAIATRQQRREAIRIQRDTEAEQLARDVLAVFSGDGGLTRKLGRAIAARTRRLDALVQELENL